MSIQTCTKKSTQIDRYVSFLILGLAFFFSCNNFAQDLASKEDLGVFHFEEEVIDYGTISQNDNGIRSFKFTNRGRAPIVISKVKTTCGCTIPTYSKQAILPGETGTIDIKYDTKRVGSFSKSITVISNADQSQKKLRIKGQVIAKPTTPIN